MTINTPDTWVADSPTGPLSVPGSTAEIMFKLPQTPVIIRKTCRKSRLPAPRNRATSDDSRLAGRSPGPRLFAASSAQAGDSVTSRWNHQTNPKASSAPMTNGMRQPHWT